MVVPQSELLTGWLASLLVFTAAAGVIEQVFYLMRLRKTTAIRDWRAIHSRVVQNKVSPQVQLK